MLPSLFSTVVFVVILAVLPTIAFTGCARDNDEEQTAVIRVAEQHGLAYLPLAIMRVENLLERELEGVGSPRVEWIRAGNAAMIREAMLSGRLDLGFMGVPPFLIGRDRGTDWRMVTGLSETPLGLVTLQSEYRSLHDLQAHHRIALPQPGSIQHILLAMASERTFGDPRRFDDRLVSMAHPEGLAALLSGRDITAHFTAPPYLFEALQESGGTLLLDGREAFDGRFTFIIGVAAPGWGEDESTAELLKTFLRALDEAIRRAGHLVSVAAEGEEPPPLLQEVARFYDLDATTLQHHLSYPGMVYTREIHGIERFIDRMHDYGYLNEDRVGAFRSEILE